jgi:transcriptional regulator with XRE-family HTH domain
MGRAGKALKQVLKTYGISQNRLAVLMGVDRSNVHYWVNETRDPLAESVIEIRKALGKINPVAAEEFAKLYWDDSDEAEGQS